MIRKVNQDQEKINRWLELGIAGCIGASVALAFVVVHAMLTTQWTW